MTHPLFRTLAASIIGGVLAWQCNTATAQDLPNLPLDYSGIKPTAWETDVGFSTPPIPPAPTSTFFDTGDGEENGEGKKDKQKEIDKKQDKEADALRKELKKLQERIDDLDKTDDELSEKLKNTVQPGTTRNSMTVSGRIHADYWTIPESDIGAGILEGADRGGIFLDPQDRFLFRRVRFGVKGKIKDNMEYKIEMEFASPNDTEYRDLYIGWLDVPILQKVRLGNQKRPYGLDHLNSSRYNVFIERPFVIEGFNEDARRLGLVSYGVSEDEAWNWRYGLYNLEKTQDDFGYVGDHYQGQFAARLANTYIYEDEGRNYAHWAIAGTVANPDGNGGPQNSNEARFRTRPEARMTSRWLNTGRIDDAKLYELLALEKVINVGPFQMVGEWQHLWLQRDGNASELKFWGGYVYASYFLTGEHIPWDRKTGILGRVKPFNNFFFSDDNCSRDGEAAGWGAWQVAARYSYADFNDNDVLGGIGEAWTFAVNWHWNANARLQFNYIVGTVDNRIAGVTASSTYEIIGLRAMVDF